MGNQFLRTGKLCNINMCLKFDHYSHFSHVQFALFRDKMTINIFIIKHGSKH